MSGYLKQKLFQALHDLVGAGDIDKRLTHAGNFLVHLEEPDIPKEYRAEVAAIKEIMFTTPLSVRAGLRSAADVGRGRRKAGAADLEPIHGRYGRTPVGHPPPCRDRAERRRGNSPSARFGSLSPAKKRNLRGGAA